MESLNNRYNYSKYWAVILICDDIVRKVKTYENIVECFTNNITMSDFKEKEKLFISTVKCFEVMKNNYIFDKLSLYKGNKKINRKEVYSKEFEDLIEIIEELEMARVLKVY